jgi:nucleotide-binding universal stress UspA family protein
MTLLFQKILCPVDFDANSIAALDIAAKLARETNGTLEVLHVIPQVIEPEGAVYVDVYSALEEASRNQLRELAAAHLAGVKFELRTAIGQPAAAILHAQNNLRVDLIVMGTHGRHGLARWYLGSVAQQVLREAQCPVLTIRENPHA